MDKKKNSRKEYQAAYRAAHTEQVRRWEREYYRHNREKILTRKRMSRAAPQPRQSILPKGWKVMFAVRGGVWSWRACKGAAILENGGFGTLKEARRDCLAALGE